MVNFIFTLSNTRHTFKEMSLIYIDASRALNCVSTGKSLKTYCQRVKMEKSAFALSAQTLKFWNIIDGILELSKVNVNDLSVDKELFYVMIYDLLFGSKKIRGGGIVRRKIMEISVELQKALATTMELKGCDSPSELLPYGVRLSEKLPRFVRINILQVSHEEGLKCLLESTKSSGVQIEIDEHIPNLLKFSQNIVGLGDHSLVKSGKIIIQDKASCFPSQILMDTWSSGDIIDACAAPGNKTSHLASLLSERNCGPGGNVSFKIFAFDRSHDRVRLLRRRLNQAGASHMITTKHADFLEIDGNSPEFSRVRYILVDPSCSGSGVVRDMSRAAEMIDDTTGHEDANELIGNNDNGHVNKEGDSHMKDGGTRLQKLHSFQVQMVKKAMSFPRAEFVVYSTCSIHKEENECVVAALLRDNPAWGLLSPPRITSWHRRGLSVEGLSEQQSHCLIRCHPSDGMNGFFVALFRKTEWVDTILTGQSDSCTSSSNSAHTAPASSSQLQDSRSHTKEAPKKADRRARDAEAGKGLTVWKPKKRRKRG